VLDTEYTEDLASWFYQPWSEQFDDEDEFALEFGAALVGSGEGDDPYLLDPDTLAADIAVLEAYRPGLPLPHARACVSVHRHAAGRAHFVHAHAA